MCSSDLRLRSGWFSDRSACYLAAGRPVVTQDTAFGDVLPTGEGLFAYRTREEAIAAVRATRSLRAVETHAQEGWVARVALEARTERDPY